MWFIVDRDERDAAEIGKMVERLGDKAKMFVLGRRELENFLIDESAIRKFISTKNNDVKISSAEMSKAVQEVAEEIKNEVAELYFEKEVLLPLYLRGRGVEGTPHERLSDAVKKLEERLKSFNEVRANVEDRVLKDWNVNKALEFAPGALFLDRVCKRFGSTFKKESGDSVKLARHMDTGDVPDEILEMLYVIISE
jgi:sRNA-binding carbon storage regulator CsrA